MRAESGRCQVVLVGSQQRAEDAPAKILSGCGIEDLTAQLRSRVAPRLSAAWGVEEVEIVATGLRRWTVALAVPGAASGWPRTGTRRRSARSRRAWRRAAAAELVTGVPRTDYGSRHPGSGRSHLKGAAKLINRRRARHASGLLAVEPARHTGFTIRLSERIAAVDEQGRRASHTLLPRCPLAIDHTPLDVDVAATGDHLSEPLRQRRDVRTIRHVQVARDLASNEFTYPARTAEELVLWAILQEWEVLWS